MKQQQQQQEKEQPQAQAQPQASPAQLPKIDGGQESSKIKESSSKIEIHFHLVVQGQDSKQLGNAIAHCIAAYSGIAREYLQIEEMPREMKESRQKFELKVSRDPTISRDTSNNKMSA